MSLFLYLSELTLEAESFLAILSLLFAIFVLPSARVRMGLVVWGLIHFSLQENEGMILKGETP